jgi:peptidyl-prolyl cis-trans isomerase D
MFLGGLTERSKGWLVKIILIFISIPFALFGVDYYFRRGGGGADSVASVDGHKITQYEFNQLLREQRDRLRGMLGSNFDSSVVDTPTLRASVLDAIVTEHLLAQQAAKAGLTVTNSELAGRIAEIPAFQDQGKFSQARYELVLRNQGMSPAGFESRMRLAGLVGEMRDSITDTTLVPKIILDSYIRLRDQQREVSALTFSPTRYESQVKFDPAVVKAYYDAHPDEFRIPEQVRLEYVLVSVEKLMADAQVTEEEIRKYYDDQLKQGHYAVKEERQASHTLIAVAPNASEADKKAARAKAEEIFKQARQSPEKFAELAAKYSQDPGSAKQGGELGFISPGTMAKAFDDAVFSMQPGEIRGPVETEFGFHIIKLTSIKPAKTRTLDEAQEEITKELKKQKAAQRFTEVADNFGNMVYEQSDSLKPAADALKLGIQKSGWVSRNEAPNDPLLNNPKLLQAVFSDDVLKDKRNTAAIEVGPNMLVAARVIDHRPASIKTFAETSGAIAEKLKKEEAAKLAAKDAQAKLAELQQGKSPPGLSWPVPRLIGRQGESDLAPAVVVQVFKADIRKLPVHVGAENPEGGYTLVKITKSVDGNPGDEAKRKSAAIELRRMLGEEEFSSLLGSLKKNADITVKREVLEQKEAK